MVRDVAQILYCVAAAFDYDIALRIYLQARVFCRRAQPAALPLVYVVVDEKGS